MRKNETKRIVYTPESPDPKYILPLIDVNVCVPTTEPPVNTLPLIYTVLTLLLCTNVKFLIAPLLKLGEVYLIAFVPPPFQ